MIARWQRKLAESLDALNVMLAAGGYPWTVVPLERRNAYMAAKEGLRGKPVAKVPRA